MEDEEERATAAKADAEAAELEGGGTPEDGMLSAASIQHIMKRAIGGEHGAVSAPAVAAVQCCTSEFISFVVSEARMRVAREGRTTVTYTDVASSLITLGFRPFLEPLKAHMVAHYGAGATKRPQQKRPLPTAPSASGAASSMEPPPQQQRTEPARATEPPAEPAQALAVEPAEASKSPDGTVQIDDALSTELGTTTDDPQAPIMFDTSLPPLPAPGHSGV